MSDEKNTENLDDLLDSALQDFDKKASTSKETQSAKSSEAGGSQNEGEPLDPEAFFEEHAKLLADRMKTLFGGAETPSGDMPPMPQDPDRVLAGFKKVAEAAVMTLEGTNPISDEEAAKYSDSIAQALKSLQKGADNLNSNINDSDVLSMLGNINLESAGDDSGNMFLPFMEGMMQSLLSAEILLPSIKELLDAYPKYLEENADKIPAEDKERYEKQMELYKVIEAHLESEKQDDTPAVKRDRFRIVLDDMKKLHDFGQPPKEILESFDSLIGDSVDNAAGPQCPTM